MTSQASDKEISLDYLLQRARAQPLSEDINLSLRPLLSSDGPLLAVLSQLALQAHDMAAGLQGMDLVSDEGRFKAVRMQGMVEGVRLAVDKFLDLGKGEEK